MMIGKFYTLRQPKYAQYKPGEIMIVRVMIRWSGGGPRNVLVCDGHQTWVRPFRGLKRTEVMLQPIPEDLK